MSLFVSFKNNGYFFNSWYAKIAPYLIDYNLNLIILSGIIL